MFIQVITGKVTDADGFQRAGESWNTDLRPGAPGFLGSTAGTTADGRFALAARFDSAESAAKNNARPEQGDWYSEFTKSVSDVEFHDCDTIHTMGGGGSDDAGFVQVMVGKIKDRAKFDDIAGRSNEIEATLKAFRTDVLGEVMAVHSDGVGYHDFIYFKSEAEARAAEKMEPPADVVALMNEMSEAGDVVDYLDLTDVMMH
jgi:hypothetical protein